MRNSRAPGVERPSTKARWRIVAADTCELRATRQKVKASAILQRRSRLGTFEPAKNLESGEVLALGNPCETAEPLQDSGPMGGRLVCRADLVWAPLNPLKAWRVERYWRWATHAKQQSLCRIQAQWVAVWSAAPISFRHLRTAKSMEVSALRISAAGHGLSGVQQ